MSLLKENCSHSINLDTLGLPPRLGRKRRSSILKPQRPFTDVQNLSRDDSRLSKDRRVSFCPNIEIKVFNKHNPAGPSSGSAKVTHGSSEDGSVKQVNLPAVEEFHTMQMSTPVKKKKRRISVNPVDRLSIIPKFDKSFYPDDDFTPFEDDPQLHTAAATAPLEEITLLEELPDPQLGDVGLPRSEGDIVLDPILYSSPQPSSFQPTTCSQEHSAPPSPLQSPPLIPSQLPVVPVDDSERLVELFPQAAVLPTVTVPTLVCTPPLPSHSHYLAMPTPEGSPVSRRRSRLRNTTMATDESFFAPLSGRVAGIGEEVAETGGVALNGGMASLEHTGGRASSMGLAGGVASMGLAGEGTGLELRDEGAGMELTGEGASMELTGEGASMELTGEGASMELTGEGTGLTDEGARMEANGGGSSMELNGEEASMTLELTGEGTNLELTGEGASVGRMGKTSHITHHPKSGPCSMSFTCLSANLSTESSVVTVNDSMPMSLTCVETTGADSYTENSNTLGGDEVVNAEHSDRASAHEQGGVVAPQSCDDTTSTELLAGSALTATNEPSTCQQPGEAGESHTSRVFKVPRKSVRSQLKLRSSGRKVVRASPCAQTPHTASNSFQRLQSSTHFPLTLNRSLAHQSLNTTFTVNPQPRAGTTSTASTPHNTANPPLAASTVILPPNTSSPPPPVTPSHRPPSILPHASPPLPSTPSAHTLSPVGDAVAVAHSLLASPPVSASSSLITAAPHTHSPWLHSLGDSFNLLNSGDETLSTANDSLPHSSADQQAQGGSEPGQPQDPSEGTAASAQSDVQMAQVAASVSHPRAPAGTTHHPPATPMNLTAGAAPSQPSRLVTALQQLRLGRFRDLPPITIETPETVPLEMPPVSNESLHVSALHVTMNDTTLCGRSVLLSPSVYDKFMEQICSKSAHQPSTDPNGVSPSSPHAISPRSSQESRGEQPTTPPSPSTLSPPREPGPSTATPPPPSSAYCPPTVAVTGLDDLPSNTLFSHFLCDLTDRLQDMLHGVHLRLSHEGYTAAHHCLPSVLDKWSRVLGACLGSLTVLQQYGEVSRVSHTHSWSSEGVPPELPLPPLGQEDMAGGLDMKLEWITELIASYNSLLPSAEVARDEAAILYGWQFEGWSHDAGTQHVTVSVQSKQLHFQLSVTDIVADRVSSTASIAQSVWDHTKTIPH